MSNTRFPQEEPAPRSGRVQEVCQVLTGQTINNSPIRYNMVIKGMDVTRRLSIGLSAPGPGIH